MQPATMRLLVVDDSASMRRSICRFLEAQGYTSVDEAADGATAYELFRQTAYDVVITDWYMPRVSGLELLRTIRNGGSRPRTPVLLLTGDVSHEREREAVEAGATGFINKPLVVLSLPDHLRQLS